MLTGKTVRLANPGPGEESARYIVAEDNGDRLLIRLICNLPIPPVELVRSADVVVMPTPNELADEFCRVLADWLTADELTQVAERNSEETDPNICHSHDFCDANAALLEAAEKWGLDFDTLELDLFNAAWTIAKARNFGVLECSVCS